MHPIKLRYMNNMNNVTTNTNNATIRRLNITCTPEQKDALLPFMETDIEAVVKLVLKGPRDSISYVQRCCIKNYASTLWWHRTQSLYLEYKLRYADDGVTQRQRCVMEKAFRQIMINNNTITSNVLASVLQIESSTTEIAQGPRHKSVIVFRTKENMYPLYRSMGSTVL
jgi:hypothetical protein